MLKAQFLQHRLMALADWVRILVVSFSGSQLDRQPL